MTKPGLKNTSEVTELYAMLTEGEQHRAVQSALEKLDDADRANIDNMAGELVDTVKAKCPNTQFSRNSALLLLSRIGVIWGCK